MTDSDPRLFFTGVDPRGRLREPEMPEALGRRLLGLPEQQIPEIPPPKEAEMDPLRAAYQHLGRERLDRVGWTAIFAAGMDPAVRRHLQPLLDLRRRQAGDRYHPPFVPGQSYDQFLARARGHRGMADPEADGLPYYVLLVGDPEAIPYEIQQELDRTYAVGRLCFARPEDYETYARTVVAAEERRLFRPREVAFFAPQHAGDRATERTRAGLVEPLLQWLETSEDGWGWKVRPYLGEAASKDRLGRLLGGAETPALLFAAAHGLLSLPPGNPRQEAVQGAVITSDWPGPGHPVEEAHRFAAGDLAADAAPGGLITFLFSCYGAGTPREDPFSQGPAEPPHVARRPFVSALATALLNAPGDPALALIGHVERTWTTTFDWFRDGRQTAPVKHLVRLLLEGCPVGMATETLGQLALDLGDTLRGYLEDRNRGRDVDAGEFARLWTAAHDARNFVVFGDPAVRLAVR